MADDSPRSLVIGMLRLQYGLAAPTIAEMFSGDRFAPESLTADELTRLTEGTLSDAPLHVCGDIPEWVLPSLEATFGPETLDELRALGRRAPLDIRVNTLKRSRTEALAGLAHLAPEPTPHAPNGLRIPIGHDGRGPALHVEPEFIDGWYEIQDEGSQLASLLSGARPGETVIDLCAGGGGKTLSLAAMMENSGRLIASDDDPDGSPRSTSACAAPASAQKSVRPVLERRAVTSSATSTAVRTASSSMRPAPAPALGGAILMRSGGCARIR